MDRSEALRNTERTIGFEPMYWEILRRPFDWRDASCNESSTTASDSVAATLCLLPIGLRPRIEIAQGAVGTARVERALRKTGNVNGVSFMMIMRLVVFCLREQEAEERAGRVDLHRLD